MRIEKTVDRGSKEKLYVQIYSIFLEKIESGKWPDGTQIPSENGLCRTYDVSKVTVREAIQELVREGYLRRQQGKGTFVTYSMPHFGIVVRTRLSEDDIYGEEVTVRKEISERGIRGATHETKHILTTNEEIYYVRRKKFVDKELYHEEYFIPLFILPEIDVEDLAMRSLYDLIEEKGTKKIFRVHQTMEIISVKGGTSEILGMKEGSPALQISRILISSDGSPIGFSRITGGGGRGKFQMRFDRIK